MEGFENVVIESRELMVSRVFRHLPASLRRIKLYRLLKRFGNTSLGLIQLQNGLKFFGNLNDQGPAKAVVNQAFDSELVHLLDSLLPARHGVFFDIGANYGLAGLSLGQSRGKTDLSMHLFEANESLIPFLQASTRVSKHVQCRINFGVVTSDTGFSSLAVNTANSGAAFATGYQGEGDAIKNIVLAEYIKRNKISKIDLVKLDIEGFEVNALRGLFNHSEVMPRAIVMEVDSGHLQRAGSSVEELFGLLTKQGYELYHWREHDYSPSYPWNEFTLDEQSRDQIGALENSLSLSLIDADAPYLKLKWGTDIVALKSAT